MRMSSPAATTSTRSTPTRVDPRSGSASEKERKSCIPSKRRPASCMRSGSRGSRIHHTKGLPKAVRLRAIW